MTDSAIIWMDTVTKLDQRHVGAVIVAGLTTLLGGATLMFWIAMVVMHVYEAMGWLEGVHY